MAYSNFPSSSFSSGAIDAARIGSTVSKPESFIPGTKTPSKKPNRKLSFGESVKYTIADQYRIQRLKDLQDQGISDVDVELNYDNLDAGMINKDEGFSYNGKTQEQFLKERESLQRKTDNKKRRGFIATKIAQNDEEGQVRRPSLLS